MHNLDSPTEHLLTFNLLPFWEYGWTHLKEIEVLALSSSLRLPLSWPSSALQLAMSEVPLEQKEFG